MKSSVLLFSYEKEQKMTKRKRRNHSSAFKAKVAVAFNLRDYLELADTSGRVVRLGKRGTIPEQARRIDCCDHTRNLAQ